MEAKKGIEAVKERKQKTSFRNVGWPTMLELTCQPLCEKCAQALTKLGCRVFEPLSEADKPCDHTFLEQIKAVVKQVKRKRK